jgi:hypothetical protein
MEDGAAVLSCHSWWVAEAQPGEVEAQPGEVEAQPGEVEAHTGAAKAHSLPWQVHSGVLEADIFDESLHKLPSRKVAML